MEAPPLLDRKFRLADVVGRDIDPPVRSQPIDEQDQVRVKDESVEVHTLPLTLHNIHYAQSIGSEHGSRSSTPFFRGVLEAGMPEQASMDGFMTPSRKKGVDERRDQRASGLAKSICASPIVRSANPASQYRK